MNRTDKEPGTSVPPSPRFFKRKVTPQVNAELANNSQGKVALGEVEQKLKSMKQKRLDRLSTFVIEQGTLSEERDGSSLEGKEMENAITSMKHSNDEKKTTFKSFVEEHATERKDKLVSEATSFKNNGFTPRTPILSRKSSNESADRSKQSSTKKFINKFNCTATSASIEDLTNDSESVISSSAIVRPANNKPKILMRSSLEENKNISEENGRRGMENTANNNPLLSPVGKQRKGIYLYERECTFLENEKSHSVFNFLKKESKSQQDLTKSSESIPGEVTVRRSFELGKTNSKAVKEIPQSEILEVKTRNSYESRSTIASEDKPPLAMKSFKRNSIGDILDSKFVNKANSNSVPAADSPAVDNKNYHFIKKPEMTNQRGYAKISKHPNISNYKPTELQCPQTTHINNEIFNKKKEILPIPPKSPIPLPRRITNEERILKKFQRSWDSLNEIAENDSDVDSDEIEDMKKTFEEVNTLLIEYCSKLNKLERKTKIDDNCSQKLDAIKQKLEKIEKQIPTYKGLKRDLSYRQLIHTLSHSLSEIHKIKSTKADVHSEKQLVMKQAENLLKILARRADRNEDILFEVLEAQVSSISTNIFNITRV